MAGMTFPRSRSVSSRSLATRIRKSWNPAPVISPLIASRRLDSSPSLTAASSADVGSLPANSSAARRSVLPDVAIVTPSNSVSGDRIPEVVSPPRARRNRSMLAKSVDPATTWTPPPWLSAPWILLRIRSAPSSTVSRKFWNTPRLVASWPSVPEGVRTRRVWPDAPPSTWQLMHLDWTTASEMKSPKTPLGDSLTGATPLHGGLAGCGAYRGTSGLENFFRCERGSGLRPSKAGHSACD